MIILAFINKLFLKKTTIRLDICLNSNLRFLVPLRDIDILLCALQKVILLKSKQGVINIE